MKLYPIDDSDLNLGSDGADSTLMEDVLLERFNLNCSGSRVKQLQRIRESIRSTWNNPEKETEEIV